MTNPLDDIDRENRLFFENENLMVSLSLEKGIPFSVWKEPSDKQTPVMRKEMKSILMKTGDEYYGRGNYLIDRYQNQYSDYMVWYARPNMNLEFNQHKISKKQSGDSSN